MKKLTLSVFFTGVLILIGTTTTNAQTKSTTPSIKDVKTNQTVKVIAADKSVNEVKIAPANNTKALPKIERLTKVPASKQPIDQKASGKTKNEVVKKTTIAEPKGDKK